MYYVYLIKHFEIPSTLFWGGTGNTYQSTDSDRVSRSVVQIHAT
jgi:hypothetical protein